VLHGDSCGCVLRDELIRRKYFLCALKKFLTVWDLRFVCRKYSDYSLLGSEVMQFGIYSYNHSRGMSLR
jgi:hypothetical protein